MSRQFKGGIKSSRGQRERATQRIRRGRRQGKLSDMRQTVARTMGPFAVSESKYFDSFKSAQTIAETTSWAATEADPTTLDTLFVPQEGSDIDNRIGRKVSVYKIALRGVISASLASDQTDTLQNPAVRLILFQDQQSNGVQAQGEELMASPGAATSALTFSTFQNLANLGRFRVLRDKTIRGTITVTGTDGASTTSQRANDIPFKITVKFTKPVVVKFNATNGGTIGDIVDNSFHLLAVKSNADYTTVISYQCRTYYKDM